MKNEFKIIGEFLRIGEKKEYLHFRNIEKFKIDNSYGIYEVKVFFSSLKEEVLISFDTIEEAELYVENILRKKSSYDFVEKQVMNIN